MVKCRIRLDCEYEDNHKKDRRYFQDPYNENKIWEVTKLKGGYYLRQYIGHVKFGRGLKVSKDWLNQIGVLNFKEVCINKIFYECIYE